jgi:hypothetical protein
VSAEEALALESAMMEKKKSLDSYDRQMQEIFAKVAKVIVLYALDELKEFKLLLQKLVLEKTFGHIIL